MATRPCPSCGKEIAANDWMVGGMLSSSPKSCPHCGRTLLHGQLLPFMRVLPALLLIVCFALWCASLRL